MAYRRLWRTATAFLCVLLVVITTIGYSRFTDASVFQPADFSDGDPSINTASAVTRRIAPAVSEESLRYVPRDTEQIWKERGYVIVFGIPSADSDARQRRRHLQRSTCWRFPGVATKANNFTGAMLVLYVLARHPSHNFTYSATLEAEAAEWHDVIALPMNEGRPSTNKTIGGGKWGNEAEIGLSRKVFRWFDMALRLFPTVTYFAKGDDDMFLRVPQYLADLRSLPRRGLFWGAPGSGTIRKGHVTHRFRFFAGMLYTLARDVVQQLVSFEPVRRLVHVPYTKKNEREFFSYKMQYEDVMVGQILRLEVRYSALVVVEDCWYRFHAGRDRTGKLRAKFMSVVLHLPPENSYGKLMKLFGSDTLPSTVLWKWRNPGLIQFFC
ncbi:UDP-Gal or UDP-GlcNAc-dependent glycosyltransferase [Trypanosoma grayi]|uniref:UDP-Gal or UDP-GlcNAc-dependent glycosyltransferase n=1 Tax=Trypanosoma grayi TaxID=71804 RepID=UPI0004F49077|nr:UDP-Gal or UDP-GlcNAc-dependent glycosyltransferase [Trypanosoma grayi]KEG07877.1 UDP-Gal or UDP-GlcNAc-dependent glycosyltransferase [Trypanosoma grayi]